MAAFVAVLLAGAALRWPILDGDRLWVDEAESSINALTILQSGYPHNRYLGLPIYENTLIRPWPDHPEYEFQDISYSPEGIAIYHGWLPLYAIAASFALHGIQPDTLDAPPARRSLQESKLRTRAARMPGLLLGVLFAAICYFAGLSMYGRDAAITALLAGAFLGGNIDPQVQARYYSAMITFSTLSVLAIWWIWTKGTWRSYLAGALAFILLFYSHLVAFAATCLVLAFVAPWLLRRRDFAKVMVFGLAVSAATLPWLVGTGFLSQLGIIPSARAYLSLPQDLLTYPLTVNPYYLLLFAVFAGGILASIYSPTWLGNRLAAPLRDATKPVLLLSVWIVTAYATFLLLIPAVSLDLARLRFTYRGPAVVLLAVFCACLARMFDRRMSVVAAPAMLAGLVAIFGITVGPRQIETNWPRIEALKAYLQRLDLDSTVKLYALPNSQLILAFYTGLPFQSIAPIRETFLTAYPGEILFVDSEHFFSPEELLGPTRLRREAALAGHSLARGAEVEISRRLVTLDYRNAMRKRLFGEGEEPEEIPTWAKPLHAEARALRLEFMDKVSVGPVFRGYPIKDWCDWVGVCFYRFVDPMKRMRSNWNYAPRLRNSRVDILSGSGWAIYRSGAMTQGFNYRLLP